MPADMETQGEADERYRQADLDRMYGPTTSGDGS